MGLKVPHTTNYLTEHFGDDGFVSLKGYEAQGGYEAARKALTRMQPEKLIELVKDSGLQGRGGAGFPTGLKWSFMPKDADRPRFLVCNADESEPGSFKDRILLERGPHQLLEGILIAAWAVGAEKTFLYIRGEYSEPARVMQQAIAEAGESGYLGQGVMGTNFSHEVVLVRGGGAYICGEETGLLESLEGKKGQPRKKPPYPAEFGAFGMPTTVNNVARRRARCAHGQRVFARAADHARHRRHYGDGRHHLHGARGLRNCALLPRRELRAVHPVPRGHGLDGEDSEPH